MKKILSLIALIAALSSCSGEKKDTISLPKPGKESADSSGIWKIQYFDDGFGESTGQPYICSEIRKNEVEEDDWKTLWLVFLEYNEDDIPAIRFENNMTRDSWNTSGIKVKFTNDNKESVLVIAKIYKNGNIAAEGEDAVKVIGFLLKSKGRVKVQLRDDETLTATFETEGLDKVYAQFCKKQKAFRDKNPFETPKKN